MEIFEVVLFTLSFMITCYIFILVFSCVSKVAVDVKETFLTTIYMVAGVALLYTTVLLLYKGFIYIYTWII